MKENEVVETVAITEEGVLDEAVEESGQDAEGAEENEGNAEGQHEEGVGKAESVSGDVEAKEEKKPLSEEDIAFFNELFKTKHKFSDGSETQIFSFAPPKLGSDLRSVVCHLCRRAYLHRLHFERHLNGRRHKGGLKKKSLKLRYFQQPFLLFYSHSGVKKVNYFKMFAGENISEVTPELEDRIIEKDEWDFKKVEDEALLKTLSEDPIYTYNKNKPIIGLDYVLKMKRNDEIQYCCTVCDILTPDVFQHVTDIKHQATYIIRHFPKLYKKVVEGLKVEGEEAKENCIRNIFRKLYRKIEMKHGFNVMLPVDAADFIGARPRYVNKVRLSPHYSEDTLEFTEAEVDALINKSNNNISFNEPDLPKLPEPRVARRLRKRRGARQPEAPDIKSARLDADEVSRWQKYVVAKEGHIKRIEAQYKRYENDPKLHPNYQKEWRQFWHTRCSELRKAKINPDTYNFKSEWRAHWETRLRKLFNIEITACKAKERKNLNLAIHKRTPSPYRPRDPKNKPMGLMENRASMLEAMMSAPNSKNFVPPMNNQQNFVGGAGVEGIPGLSRRARKKARQRQQQQVQQQQVQQQQQQQVPQQQQQQPSRKRPAASGSREPVSVISVLRLLTALEDQLGSLGPKSIQLLGHAALCGKNNKAKQLLTDHEYYVFFVTAKEKLKGQIMANVMDKSKVHAAETAIEDLNSIVNMMDKENSNQGEGAGSGGAAGGNSNQNANAKGSDYNGENLGRNYAGGNNNNCGNFRHGDGQINAGGNFRNEGYRDDGGNFRNDNGDFAGNNANYRSNPGSFGGINDAGNYRSIFNDDNASNRMTSNFDNSNYRGGNDDSNFGNDGGSYRSNNDDMRTFRRGNFKNESGSYSQGTGGSYFSNSNSSDFGNYRGGNDLTGGKYRSTGSSLSGGSSNTGGGMGFASNTNQYRSGGNYSNDNFNAESSNFSGGVAGSNSSSTKRGSWMGGSGNVYSNKSNAFTPVYGSGLGGFNSQQQNSFTPSYSTRNKPPAPSFNMSSGGGSGSNYRRYN